MNPVKRILVVDDEPAILLLLKQILAAEGYDVVTASDGNEAHRLSRAQWFDLFLIDLIMPGMDGIETILSLRTFRKNAPIIAMSGGWQNGMRNYLPLADKLGVCATLPKPFDLNTLLRTVQSVLGKGSAGRQARFPQRTTTALLPRHGKFAMNTDSVSSLS